MEGLGLVSEGHFPVPRQLVVGNSAPFDAQKHYGLGNNDEASRVQMFRFCKDVLQHNVSYNNVVVYAINLADYRLVRDRCWDFMMDIVKKLAIEQATACLSGISASNDTPQVCPVIATPCVHGRGSVASHRQT